MRMTLIALATFATVLTVAPDAFGFGGGGRGNGGGSSGSFGASGGGNVAAATSSGGKATASTAEPLAALAVGLGLLGARYLRRR